MQSLNVHLLLKQVNWDRFNSKLLDELLLNLLSGVTKQPGEELQQLQTLTGLSVCENCILPQGQDPWNTLIMRKMNLKMNMNHLEKKISLQYISGVSESER